MPTVVTTTTDGGPPVAPNTSATPSNDCDRDTSLPSYRAAYDPVAILDDVVKRYHAASKNRDSNRERDLIRRLFQR